jgi:palmitoyl-protein thioesterase
VAIFHGISDSCLFPGMSRITNFFSTQLGGVYSVCIESGGGPLDWFTSFHSQAEKACEKVKNDKNLQGEFSVVGISQGALIARYIIEKCEMKGTVKRYVSIGGPQMGVGSLPQCTSGVICETINKLIGYGVYTSISQEVIGPAGYYKDITNYNTYLDYSTFLADLNNEKEKKNENYKQRFLALENVVMIKFSQDLMIIPKETAWFQFYNQDKSVGELVDSEFYKNDFIGVKALHEQKKIKFVELEGNHLNFGYEDISEYMIPALS